MTDHVPSGSSASGHSSSILTVLPSSRRPFYPPEAEIRAPLFSIFFGILIAVVLHILILLVGVNRLPIRLQPPGFHRYPLGRCPPPPCVFPALRYPIRHLSSVIRCSLVPSSTQCAPSHRSLADMSTFLNSCPLLACSSCQGLSFQAQSAATLANRSSPVGH